MRDVDKLKLLMEAMLQEASTFDVDGWSVIEGEEGTYGVTLADGREFFISITEA